MIDFGDAILYNADCIDVIRGLDANSIDAIVCDPPAGIGFMGKTWDKPGVLGVSGGRAMPVNAAFSRNPSCKKCHGRQRAGAATKGCHCEEPEWNDRDHLRRDRQQFIDFMTFVFEGCARIAKPGAHLACWAIPRTSHWTGTAIEDAGWVIEDVVCHHFGNGFPKHKSKLKPATEFWWLATKPGGKKWLGVDRCRIGSDEKNLSGRWPANLVLSHHSDCVKVGSKIIKGDPRGDLCGRRGGGFYSTGASAGDGTPNARVYGDQEIPVYECHPDCPVLMIDHQSGPLKSGARKAETPQVIGWQGRHGDSIQRRMATIQGGVGYASRFFYVAKASKTDRNEGGVDNTHPTVKSTDLMRWLCNLVTPPGGVILDPFMGSGTTGKAAIREGFKFIGIEKDTQEGYFEIAKARIAHEIREREKRNTILS